MLLYFTVAGCDFYLFYICIWTIIVHLAIFAPLDKDAMVNTIYNVGLQRALCSSLV